MEQKSSVRRILLTPLLSLSAAVKEQKRVLLVFQCLHQHHQWRQLFTKNLFYVCSEKTLCASSPKKKMSSPRIVKVSEWQVALKDIFVDTFGKKSGLCSRNKIFLPTCQETQKSEEDERWWQKHFRHASSNITAMMRNLNHF